MFGDCRGVRSSKDFVYVGQSPVVEFTEFAGACEKIEEESSNLAMTEMVSDMISGLKGVELGIVTNLVMGRVFTDWSGKELD